MSDYRYTIKSNTIQVIDKEQELTVYDFGSWQTERVSRYRVLLALKKDMEYAEAYEVQVDPDYRNILDVISKLKRQFKDDTLDITCGYEAGCLGYTLYHHLDKAKGDMQQ